MSSIAEVLSKRGVRYRTDAKGSDLCTIRVGGAVAAVVEPLCADELIRAVSACLEGELQFAVIGKGSNLILSDDLSSTVLIRTTALDTVRVLSRGRILGACGASLSSLSYAAARGGMAGLSFAAGIPGTLGGGVWMNAGAYGRSLSDAVEQVTVFDLEGGNVRTIFNHELGFSYRYCRLQQEKSIILSATLCLPEQAAPESIFAEMHRLSAQRRSTQPLDLPSAGSVFRRPSSTCALSAILDRLGLKGLSVGGAAVSLKHAGFIVNTGTATARDVRALIQKIQTIVENDCGFRPTPEVRFIPEEL